MKLKRTLLISILLLLATGAVVRAASGETLTIGFIGGTAENSPDRALYQAAVLAAEQINAGDDDDVPGISGPDNTRYNFDVTYYGADTAKDAVDQLDTATKEGVSAVLGPQNPDQAQAIKDAGTPDVPVIFGSPDAPTGSRLFRAAASYDTWAKAAGNYLAKQRQFSKIVIVSNDTAAASDAAKAFRSAAGSGSIAATLTHKANADDFASDAQTIRDEKADAVFAWTYTGQTARLLDALNAVGWDGVLVAPSVDVDAVKDSIGAVSLISLGAWSPSAYTKASENFVRDYQKRWDTTPPEAAAAYYDAVYLLAGAVEKAGRKPSSISNRLNGVDYTGVQGSYKNVKTEGVSLVQVRADGGTSEAARYDDGDCQGCVSVVWPDTTSKSARSSETFNIGLITTTDGPNRALGQNIENAVQLAVRQINEAGGVVRSNVRYTLSLRVYNATTSDEAAEQFKQAVSDGMKVVLGPDANGQILTNLSAPKSNSVPQLVSATDGQITTTESDDYVFQIRPTDKTMVQAVADYLLNVRDLKQFATVAARADYGLDAVDAFSDVVSASDDGKLVARLEHELDATDFKPLAEKIAASGAQAVVAYSTQPAASALLDALNGLNWKGVFVYGYLTPDYAASLKPNDGIEVVGPTNWWPGAGGWASSDFTNRYTARYNEAPQPQSAAYYDAVYLVAKAVEKNGASSTNIQKWLTGADGFNGVQGAYSPKTYDTGELTRSVRIVGLDGGNVVELARYDAGECLIGCED
jgi:ABC-type branched-subunit amino acid transport system substrate-binding protein